MPVSPPEFFQLFFSELEKRGIPAVILHGYEELPEVMSSDVDYAVRECDRARMRALQYELAERHGWLVAQELRHQVFASYTVLVDAADPANFLKLDVCSHYVKDRCFLVPDEVLLAGRRPLRGFFVPAPAAEFIYVLAKVFGKNKDPQPFVARLRELWELDREGAESQFARLMGDDLGSAESWLARPASEWAQLDTRMRSRNRYSAALMLREAGRMARRVVNHTGLCVAILGVDGAGKSTQIERLRARECFRNVKYFHFRPMVFERREGQAAPVTDPHGQEPRSPLASIAKVAYYAVDQFVGWWLRVAPAIARSSLVVFDRWFDDILVDQRRYRLSAGAGLAKLLRRFLPKPHLTIALDAPPEVARARTPELEPAEIERQRGVFRQLAAENANWHIVSSVPAPDDVAREVGGRIAAFLAARERRRSGIGAWAALFRSGGEVELKMRTVYRGGEPWLALPRDTAMARAALALYPAQTRKARVLRDALGLALGVGWPGAKSFCIAKDDPFLVFIERCGGSAERFAVLPGNPRAAGRRHTFLVFNEKGTPVAVIKAGLGATACELIRREREFLADAPREAAGLIAVWDGERAAAFATAFAAGRTPEPADDAALSEILTRWVSSESVEADAIQPLADVMAAVPASRSLLAGTFRQTLWHGDFAPWNIRIAADGRWQVLDWERAERCGPPGWDWFHFVIQRAVLVERRSVPELSARADALLASPQFRRYAELAGISATAPALFAAYLMHCIHVVRQADGRTALEGLLAARV